jgi:hypothetical protein
LGSSFYFEDLSIFWLYFLVFFHKKDNYLSKIPLSYIELNKLRQYRYTVRSYPFFLANYKEFQYFQKKNFSKNFNTYKKYYKFFKKNVYNSNFFNKFFGQNLFFLKFLHFEKMFSKQWVIHFFLKHFLFISILRKKINNISFKDFYFFSCLSIFKFAKSRNSFVKQYSKFDLTGIDELLNQKKAYIPAPDFFEDKIFEKYLKFFHLMKLRIGRKATLKYNKF